MQRPTQASSSLRRSWSSSLRRAAVALAVCAAALPAASSQAQPAKPGPPPAELAKATSMFQEARKLFDQKKFSLALAQFRASYDIVPSPNSLLYVARCQVELGDPKEAYHTYQRVITEAGARAAKEPKYGPTRDGATTELNTLKTKLGVITLNVRSDNPLTRVRIGNAPVARTDWGVEIPVDVGTFDVTMEIPNAPPVVQRVVITPGQASVVVLAPAVATTPVVVTPIVVEHGSSGPFLPVAVTLAGVGVVGMGMFAVAGSLSKGTFSDLQTACGDNGPCSGTSQNDNISKGKTEQNVANAGLIIGAVGLAASVPFFILTATSKKHVAVEVHAKNDVEVTPLVGPGYLGLHGKF